MADTAQTPRGQPRRSGNRIIPAVPHRFSRPPAARPITPEESIAVTQRLPAPLPPTKSPKPEPPIPVQTPLTPDSRLSPINAPDEPELPMASSPAHDYPEDTPDTQGVYFCRVATLPVMDRNY